MAVQLKGSVEAGFRGVHSGVVGYEAINVSSNDFSPGVSFLLAVSEPTTSGASSTIAVETWNRGTVNWTVTEAAVFQWSNQWVICRSVRTSGTTLAAGAVLSVAFP